MRSAAALVLTATLTGCGTFTTSVDFETLDHLHTTWPRSLAEGGHSTPIVPPPGVRWSLTLAGRRDEHPGQPVQEWFEVALDVAEPAAGSDAPVVLPRFDEAVLVDDEGVAFTPNSIERHDEPAEGDAEAPTETWTARFDVPATYRFSQVGRATLHWALQIDGSPPLPISSRFRQ